MATTRREIYIHTHGSADPGTLFAAVTLDDPVGADSIRLEESPSGAAMAGGGFINWLWGHGIQNGGGVIYPSGTPATFFNAFAAISDGSPTDYVLPDGDTGSGEGVIPSATRRDVVVSLL